MTLLCCGVSVLSMVLVVLLLLFTFSFRGRVKTLQAALAQNQETLHQFQMQLSDLKVQNNNLEQALASLERTLSSQARSETVEPVEDTNTDTENGEDWTRRTQDPEQEPEGETPSAQVIPYGGVDDFDQRFPFQEGTDAPDTQSEQYTGNSEGE